MKVRHVFAVTAALLMGTAAVGFAEEKEKPLVLSSEAMTEKFSPFYASSVPDQNVVDFVFNSLLVTDRLGGIVYDAGKDGGVVVPYNGHDHVYKGPANVEVKFDKEANKTYYTAHLRKDLKWSDGKPLTADDVIFSYYVYLDPTYSGATTLRTYPIVGLKDYLTQTSSAVYDKYAKIADEIATKGRDYKVAKGDDFTQEQLDAYWKAYDAKWTEVDGKIEDYVLANYKKNAGDVGLDPEKIGDAEKPALALGMWGFADYDKDTGVLKVKSTEKEFKVKEGQLPTAADLHDATVAQYKGDLKAYSTAEDPDKKDGAEEVRQNFISDWGSKDKAMAGKGVPNVAGVKKLDDYTVQVVTEGYSAPAVYQIFGAAIAPLHYYGDPKQYDYANNKFGHPYKDLSIVEAKTAEPKVGWGPYVFDRYENRVAYLKANPYYFKGEPKTKLLQLKETQNTEVAPGVKSGAIDGGELSASKPNIELVKGYNSNHELSGDVVYTTAVDNRGYGYIGLSADRVNVGGKEHKDSEESKALRKGFATLLAAYRNIVYESYYGEAAGVIEYPISNTSWAAPQPTDPGYRPAFSVDVDGNEIYTADQTFEQREKAALDAAIGWFKKAGYTFDENTGKFTKAPEGARMSYEVILGGGGTGDHPSFAVLTHVREALAKIGLELKINDPADGSVLWTTLEAGKADMWCAAWQTVIDPDMYQIYHSDNVLFKTGSTGSNKYGITDPELDQLITDARQSDDQAYRKTVYKEALDIIADWAVEVPAYQRKQFMIYSSERIKTDTLPQDPTTYWNLINEIEKVEMK